MLKRRKSQKPGMGTSPRPPTAPAERLGESKGVRSLPRERSLKERGRRSRLNPPSSNGQDNQRM